MATTVVRCPYCVSGEEFHVMASVGNGIFACAKCGHLAIPDDVNFKCHCKKCKEVQIFDHRLCG
jgi:hypothetical protein